MIYKKTTEQLHTAWFIVRYVMYDFSSSGFGFLSGLRNLVGSKTLTREDVEPVLNKMKDHLIGEQGLLQLNVKIIL